MSPEEIDNTILLIDKARIKLMQSDLSFFGHILLQLKQEYEGVSTVAVSVDTIFYNLDFIHKNVKNTNDMVFIFMHEIMHLVLDHLDKKRIKDKDMKVWNMAGDHVINLDLFASGYNYSNPKSILNDKKYIGLSTEEVYDLLINDPNTPKESDGWSDIIPSENGEEMDAVKDMVVAAYNNHVLTHGTDDNIPGSIRTIIDDIKNQILPWQSLLKKYITEVTKNDFSWLRLNMSFFPEFYIPGLYDQSLSKIDFAIDVSGSIDINAFNTFINEIKNVLTMQNITKIGIYQFNTRTVSYDVVCNLNELHNVKFNGGGGTDIKDTLEQCTISDSIALFVITDGYMNLKLDPINKPVIWCVYNNKNFKEPFGSTLIFDDYI